jgi:hypothetical protein
MIDDQLHGADPYRPEIVRHLDGADQTLLEEIMSADRMPAPWRRRLIAPIAAAAALIGVLAVSAAIRHERPATHEAARPTPTTTSDWSPLVLRAAEQNPRLLIQEPGWKITTVYGFTENTGTMRFTKGDHDLEVNWYPAKEYQGYYTGRLDVSKPEPGAVDGVEGTIFTYSASDFAIMLKPNDDTFAELRTGGKWTRSAFDQELTRIKRVDVQTWLAAMPPEIVTPGRAGEAAAKALEGVPLPPKFDRSALDAVGTNDQYQFGAAVAARVGCGWIEEWQRASKAGDQAALKTAARALRGSHQWKFLQQMDKDGDYPEAFWEVADRTAAGNPPAGYRDALGCP